MRGLTQDDLLPLSDYAAQRREFFAAHRRYLDHYRRVRIGPKLTLLFENRQTLWFRVQELLRSLPAMHHPTASSLPGSSEWPTILERDPTSCSKSDAMSTVGSRLCSFDGDDARRLGNSHSGDMPRQ